MAKNFVLILGGARSGKSNFAQDLAKKLGRKILFVATAQPLDAEMAFRIEEHKKMRPQSWRTLEIDSKIGQRLLSEIKDAEVILLDCITLLISNILTSKDNGAVFSSLPAEGGSIQTPVQAEKQALTEIADLIACIEGHEGSFIVVSNELGLGLVPDTPLGRIYRDILGKANQLLAQHASEVYFMIAGIPIKIKG